MHHLFTRFCAVFLLVTGLLATGYAGELSAPLINPLGDMAAYTRAERVDNTTLVLEIPAGDAIRTEEIAGDAWYLGAEGEDPAAVGGSSKPMSRLSGRRCCNGRRKRPFLKKRAKKARSGGPGPYSRADWT